MRRRGDCASPFVYLQWGNRWQRRIWDEHAATRAASDRIRRWDFAWATFSNGVGAVSSARYRFADSTGERAALRAARSHIARADTARNIMDGSRLDSTRQRQRVSTIRQRVRWKAATRRTKHAAIVSTIMRAGCYGATRRNHHIAIAAMTHRHHTPTTRPKPSTRLCAERTRIDRRRCDRTTPGASASVRIGRASSVTESRCPYQHMSAWRRIDARLTILGMGGGGETRR